MTHLSLEELMAEANKYFEEKKYHAMFRDSYFLGYIKSAYEIMYDDLPKKFKTK